MKFFEHIGRDLQESFKKILRDYAEALVLALIMAIFLRWVVFGSYRVDQVTMMPTFYQGDFIIGYKLPYGVSLPFFGQKLGKIQLRRFDSVIYSCEVGNCLKRIIALEGDKVEIKNGKLTLNDVPATYKPINQDQAAYFAESWAEFSHSVEFGSELGIDFGPEVVPPGMVLLLDDRRFLDKARKPEDQSVYRTVPIEAIEARAQIILFSRDLAQAQTRWSRVFKFPN
jgi:signal peptidase I